jgi:(2R)-3-sulfolactate dehydrogenase (NADP+)
MGFYWLDYYFRQHLSSDKVDWRAKSQVTALTASSFRVDAWHGFAHSAIKAGFARLITAAMAQRIAAMAVFNSYSAAT